MTVDSPVFASIAAESRQHRLGARLVAKRERWLLWLPVAAGLGIAGYFALAHEPAPWIGWAVLGAASAAALLGRRGAVLLPTLLVLIAVAAGFVAAQTRTKIVAGPVLTRPLDGARLTARVVQVEPRGAGVRLLLAEPEIARLAAEATPERVRVTLRGRTRPVPGTILPGDTVRLRARLAPPGPPAAPGAFDFRRHAWFLGIGATGFGYTRPELVARGDGGLLAGVARLRQGVFERVTASLDGAAAASRRR